MICLKGCSKEIEMLNELLSKSKEELSQDHLDSSAQLTEFIRFTEQASKDYKEKDAKIEDLTQANLRAATAFKNCETDKLKLEQELKEVYESRIKSTGLVLTLHNRIKELESQLLNFEKKNLPPEWIKSNGEPFIINTSYNEPVTGQPLFEEDPSIVKYPAKKKK